MYARLRSLSYSAKLIIVYQCQRQLAPVQTPENQEKAQADSEDDEEMAEVEANAGGDEEDGGEFTSTQR